MSQSRATKRIAPDALGMKALITAASLAVTLGGWAILAVEQPTISTSEAPMADPGALQAPASGLELNMAPLPTLVQAPAPPPKIIVLSPHEVAGIQHVAGEPALQAISQPTPATPPPTVSQAPLRVVAGPPKPIARTRSSR